MAVLEPINIDFQAISTGDPKVLVILDISTWGIIVDKPAIIEIIPPNKTNPLVYTFQKGKTNVFNTSNLLLSAIECFNDMPDGLYQITVKGSPDSNCKHRDFLKTDRTQLELYKLYASLGIDNNAENRDRKQTIQDIDLLIRSAKANIALGSNAEGIKRFRRAIQSLKDYDTCNIQ